MKINLSTSAVLLAFLVQSCGSEDPSFLTQGLGQYMVEVDEKGSSIDLDEYSYEVDSFSDEKVMTASLEDRDVGQILGDDSNEPSSGGNSALSKSSSDSIQGKSRGKSAEARKSQLAADDDSAGGTSQNGSDSLADNDDSSGGGQSDGGGQSAGGGQSDDGGAPLDDAAIAKACAPHFRGLGTKIKVLSVDRPNPTVTISPDMIIAFHLRGNEDKIDLNLGASSGIAGLCLFLSGNGSSAIVKSASNFKKLVYTGRGNLSQGRIMMQGGASIGATSISLSGNQAHLSITGVAEGSCSGAKIKGNSPTLKCGN